MTLFDLLFLATAVTTVALLISAAVLALVGQRGTSGRLVRGLLVGLTGYLAVGVVVSLARPQHVVAVGDPWCFDDWCLTVEQVTHSPTPAGVAYTVALRISSRARGVFQRANGAWIYLLDERGHRYAPEPRAHAVALDTLLGPGASVSAQRRFDLPEGIPPVGLVTGHGGPYCGPMSFLVIGGAGCLFHKPPMIRLP